MRVEEAADFEPRARLRRYTSALGRRWYFVAVLAVLGVGLGWASAPAATDDLDEPVDTAEASSDYYSATHVLIAEPSGAVEGSGGGNTVDLPQAAYLVNTGEVPVRVAQELGLDADDLEESLLGLPRVEVSSVEVIAIGTDKERVVQVADSAASHLLDVLQEEASSEAEAVRQELVTLLDELDQQIQALNSQLVGNPPNATQLEAQRQSLSNQYGVVYEQFSTVTNAPLPGAGLTSLEGARPRGMDEDDFEELKETIQKGADYVIGGGTTPPTVPLEPAPSEPGEPASRPVRAGLGGIVGLALGVGLAMLADRFDNRLRRRNDVEAATQLRVVAEIPPEDDEVGDETVIAFDRPRSRSAESYRTLRSSILYALGSKPPPEGQAAVVLVTSATPGEGKTTTATNLSAVLAEAGLRVMVVNCDFRRPRASARLMLPADLASVSVEDAFRPHASRIPGVRIVPGVATNAEISNPADMVAYQRYVIDRARPHVDIILLDTAPILATNDANELLVSCDLTLLVVRAGTTSSEEAGRAADVLRQFSAPLPGVVFNSYSELHGAQYYYAETDREDRRGPRARRAKTPTR